MPGNNETLRELFAKFFLFLENSSYTFGQIGVVQDGSPLIYVPGKSRQYVLVRVYSASGVSITEAVNTKVVPELGLWVKMRENSDGILEIKDAADAQSLASFSGNAPNLSIGPHSHRLGISGLEDLVEGRRLEPGGVYIDETRGQLWIRVMPLHHNGGFYPGNYINLAPYLPTSLNQKRWIKVGIDRDTNTIELVTGTAVSIGVLMNEADLHLAAFNFTGTDVLPLAGIVLRGDENVFTRSSRFVDLRYWAGGTGAAGGSGFTGLHHWEVSDGTGLTTGSTTEVYFSDFAFTYDTNSFYDGANDDRVEIVTGGRYLISVNYTLDEDTGTNGWNRAEIEVVKNAANTPLFYHTGHVDTTGEPAPTQWSFSQIVDLEVNDYVRVRAQRTNGVDTILVDLFSFHGILIDPD